MGAKLSEYDRQPLPSNPTEPRWWSTAKSCRGLLVRQGYLGNESPLGVWVITDSGRRYLEGLNRE